MPQLIGIALLGGLAWFGYRAFRAEMDKLNLEREKEQQRQREARKGKSLKPGEDGVYRLGDDE